MTTTPDQEEQLQLLDALITEYIKKERNNRNIQDECSDENIEINKKWREIQLNVENQINGEPIVQSTIANNELVYKTKEKISQIINSSNTLRGANQHAVERIKKIDREFALNMESREYISLQDYLRSIANSGKPELDIFEKIDKAIEDLKPLERLAADLDPEHLGKLQLRKRIELFVEDLSALLNNGKGSLALETVG